MALIDRVKYDAPDDTSFVWKYPSEDLKIGSQDVVQSALTKNKDSTEQLITNLGLSPSTVFGYLKNKPIAKNPKSKSGGGGKKWFYIIAAILIILYLM